MLLTTTLLPLLSLLSIASTSVQASPLTAASSLESRNNDGGKKVYGGKKMDSIFSFSSTYRIVGTPDQVRNGTTPAPGAADAYGYFDFGLNVAENVICYNITLLNVVGDYRSPALTATHIHEAGYGASGPPRIAFPNPIGDDVRRNSIGCLKGPFRTGINATDGTDTGAGFTVARIEANPKGFFADSHTALFPLGVVRGNLA